MLYLDFMYLHYFKNYSGLVCVKWKQSHCISWLTFLKDMWSDQDDDEPIGAVVDKNTSDFEMPSKVPKVSKKLCQRVSKRYLCPSICSSIPSFFEHVFAGCVLPRYLIWCFFFFLQVTRVSDIAPSLMVMSMTPVTGKRVFLRELDQSSGYIQIIDLYTIQKSSPSRKKAATQRMQRPWET